MFHNTEWVSQNSRPSNSGIFVCMHMPFMTITIYYSTDTFIDRWYSPGKYELGTTSSTVPSFGSVCQKMSLTLYWNMQNRLVFNYNISCRKFALPYIGFNVKLKGMIILSCFGIDLTLLFRFWICFRLEYHWCTW